MYIEVQRNFIRGKVILPNLLVKVIACLWLSMQWSKIFFEEESKKKYKIESDAMHTTYSLAIGGVQ